MPGLVFMVTAAGLLVLLFIKMRREWEG